MSKFKGINSNIVSVRFSYQDIAFDQYISSLVFLYNLEVAKLYRFTTYAHFLWEITAIINVEYFIIPFINSTTQTN